MNRQWWAIVRLDYILFSFKTKEEALEKLEDGEELVLLQEVGEVIKLEQHKHSLDDWLV